MVCGIYKSWMIINEQVYLYDAKLQEVEKNKQ